jgi:aminoglycoside phosphotransferase (APT) family kinase protein
MTRLDASRLEPYLSEKLGAEALSITRVWKNLEGWSMETYSLGLSYRKDGRSVEQDIILRKAPETGLMDDNYDVSIEYRVLTAFSRTDVAVPKTYWYEPDPEVLGRPFYAMERVEGSIPYPPPVSFDPDFRLIPDDEERRSLAEDFVRNLALIHTADWRSLGLEFLGVPGPGEGAALMQVEYWEDRIARAGFGKKPVVAYAANWLRDNLVENDRVCVAHGDYRSGNYIQRDGRIVAILDWELVHLGDPLDDIAYILGTWRSAPPHSWISHLLPEGEFFDRYEEASGIRVDPRKLEFYHMLNKFKALGIGCTASGAWRSRHDLDLRIGVFSMTHYLSAFALISELHKHHSAGGGERACS